MITDMIKTFGPILLESSIGGTALLLVFLLPVYFLRRKKNPRDQQNTIWGLIGRSFVAALLFAIVFVSGLISMYIDDEKGKTDPSVNKGDNTMEYTQIDMEQAKSIFETTGDYIILDVRRVDEYQAGHIPGAINVPNESIRDTEPAELPDKKQTIYVYCRSGNRSRQAAGKLAAMGYEHIIEFGGIMDWTGDIER